VRSFSPPRPELRREAPKPPEQRAPSNFRRWLVVALGTAFVFLGFAALFQQWTSPWAFPRFVVVAALLIWLPGRFVLDSLRVRTTGLEAAALALVLGMLASSIVYWFLLLAGAPWLIVVWVLAAAAFTGRRGARRRQTPRDTRPAFRREHALLAAVIGATFAMLILLPDYWRNFSERPDGSLRVLAFDDVVFHVSLTRELTHTVPPEVPYLSGTTLTYHYGMDLVGAMLAKFAGLNVLDVTVRFLPMLFLVMTALATYSFARAWLRSALAAALATSLVLLGEDLSFLFGYFKHSHTYWLVQYFEVPAIFSFFSFNPNLISVGILMTGLLALYRWMEGGPRSWALIAGFTFALLWEYKVFVAQLMLAALALGAVIEYVRRRPDSAYRLVYVFGAMSIVVLPLAVYTVFGTEVRGVTSAAIAPHPYVVNALRATGFRIDEVTTGAGRLILLALVGLPFYFIFNLGMRLVALPAILSRRFRLPTPNGMRLVVALVIAFGILLTFVTRISLKIDPVNNYDNAVWFYVAAKYLMWILAVEVVVAAWLKGWRRPALGLACLMVLLSIPSTVQFVGQVRDELTLESLPATEVQLLRDLDRQCSGETVALADPQLLRPMVTLTDCETPGPARYAEFFTTSLVAGTALQRRVDDVRSFWREWRNHTCDAGVVQRYGVSYVVGTRDVAPPSRCRSLRVERVDESGRFVTYRLVATS
jgi:hypothetical protein